MSDVYTRRLSGPKIVADMTGVTLHVTVPAGRVYVIRSLLVVATTATALDLRATLITASGVAASCYGLIVDPFKSISQDLLLPLTAGETLHLYKTATAGPGLATISGYDFDG